MKAQHDRTISRGKIVDLLVRGGQSVALTEHRCIRLTEIPTEILLFVDKARSLTDLRVHLEEQFGSAPEDKLEEILAELLSADLLG